jgi:hypothetical protein
LAGALGIFRRRRVRNLFGLLRHRPLKTTPQGTPASVELVWMPLYAFRMVLIRGGRRTKVWVSIDASFGGFALFERMDELEERMPDGDFFDPVIDGEKAERLARDGMVRLILRRRGTKPDVEGVDDRCFYYTPVWVYYFRRFGKKIDLAVLDGYTGDKMGARMRIAVLDAFIRRRNERLGIDTGPPLERENLRDTRFSKDTGDASQ